MRRLLRERGYTEVDTVFSDAYIVSVRMACLLDVNCLRLLFVAECMQSENAWINMAFLEHLCGIACENTKSVYNLSLFVGIR